MKHVLLLTAAAYLNGGAYVDAGTTVGIGEKTNEITEERAEEIVRMGRAELVEVEESEESEEGEGEGAEQPKPSGRRGARG